MRRQIRITFSRETRASMRKVRCSSRAALSPPFPVRHRRHSRNAKIRSTLYRAPLFTVRDERIAPSYHQGQPLEPTRGLTSISPTIRFEPAQLRKSSVQTPESSPSFIVRDKRAAFPSRRRKAASATHVRIGERLSNDKVQTHTNAKVQRTDSRIKHLLFIVRDKRAIFPSHRQRQSSQILHINWQASLQ